MVCLLMWARKQIRLFLEKIMTAAVPDYALLGSALANGGIAPNGEKILSAGTVELLHINQLTEEQQKDFNWPQLKGYGYGLGVRTMVNKAGSGTVGNLGEFGWEDGRLLGNGK